ncbi:MAG: hypothetical protein H7301_13150 [Cryobacterium sp.]|nr:hypothetical protein [Oligoflexia bacterium]
MNFSRLSILLAIVFSFAAHADDSKIVGTWFSPCKEVTNGSYQTKLMFDADGQLVTKDLKFNDLACFTTPTVVESSVPYRILSETEDSVTFYSKNPIREEGGLIDFSAEFHFNAINSATLKLVSAKILIGGRSRTLTADEIGQVSTVTYDRR